MRKYLRTNYILRRLRTAGVTTLDAGEFRRLFDLPAPRAHRVLHRLVIDGALDRLRRGRYLVSGPGGPSLPPLVLATRLVEPSYVSFWSALHFYGWTEQAPRQIQVANTRWSGRRRLDAYAFSLVRVAPRRFFGYALAREGDSEFPVAEPEKALLDALYLPRLAGGTAAVRACLAEALEALDEERLAEYAIRMGVRSLCSRLGHLLEERGREGGRLRGSASSVYVKLDPRGPRRGRFDAKWRVINNLGGD